MSSVDLHPEELFDRVRRGAASAAEQARVEEHLQRCETCRFEHALLAQSTREAAARPQDVARAQAIAQATLATLTARGVVATRAQPVRRRRTAAWLAGALVSSLATAAAAAVITQPQWFGLMQSSPAAATSPEPAQPAHRRNAATRPAERAKAKPSVQA